MQSRLDDGFFILFIKWIKSLELLEQARNSEAFKQKMAEMQTMKTANEKK